MTAGPRRRVDAASLLGLPVAIGVVLFAQVLEGGSVRSLWQPTAALVVFGGTAGAVVVSFPLDAVVRTVVAVFEAFVRRTPAREMEATVGTLVSYAMESRRKGLLSLEPALERTPAGFLRNALTLAVDGTNPKTSRQILDIENQAHRVAAEMPAEVLETAAGYTPTLGILGAVLGLIHVMASLSEPAKLGSGIAVAFVATIYGVGAANLLLLPLATRLRGRARDAARHRELVIEGIVALQEGLNPRLIEQKLRSFVSSSQPEPRAARAA
jgi:chemotaxis protein MotA